MAQINTNDILNLLIGNGPLSTKEVCDYLHISQPVCSRLLGRLTEKVLVTGRARATRYAAKRNIAGVGTNIPIYKINEKGTASHWGTLTALEPTGFYFESRDTNILNQYYAGPPYFLDDLTPSGFLGRLLPRYYSMFPADIRHWTEADCFKYWTDFGWDLIGNLILGEKAFQLYLQHAQTKKTVAKSQSQVSIYAKLAINILKEGAGGSSAGGEQPKFLAVSQKNSQDVLVKFSPPLTNAIARRLGDLLVCEHLAHKVLNERGTLACRSRLMKDASRIYLESERFDRVGLVGRRGVVSLRALDLEFVGGLCNWSQTALELMRQQIIATQTFLQIRFLEFFGKLIGNTDMHAGNLSFFMEGTTALPLAPAYDMLPMLYFPQHDELVTRDLELPVPSPADADAWRAACLGAQAFWQQTLEHSWITKEFKKIAKENLKKIKTYSVINKFLPK